MKYLALGLVVMLPTELKAELAAFIGCITSWAYLENSIEHKTKVGEAASGEYVAWRLAELEQ